MQMAIDSNKSDAVLNKQITIRGNTGLAQHFGAILANMDIDWEEQLSHITGDIPAHFTGQLARSIGNYGKNLVQTSQWDIEEYLIEELRINPHRLELQAFIDGVDNTRDDVERLQQRIEQLRNKIL